MLNLKDVSCCLITKDPVYPKEILDRICGMGFGEILILTNSDSPHRKHDLFSKTKHDWVFYQDDDAICPIEELLPYVEDGKITQAIKQAHFDAYKNKRLSVGLGWGAFFQKKLLTSLDKYKQVYGEDFIFKRETERILTYLNYPQNRIILPIQDLPSAMAPDRLSMQPNHYNYIPIVEERCKDLI